MSTTNQLIQLIESLDKKEFDQIIKIYLEEEYEFKKVVFTDGKNDTGIDIKIFDYQNKKIQYQLTTQKSETKSEKNSFEKKLIEDIVKAKENLDYGYENNLIFFYSKKLTNLKIREYQKMAFKDFGINLEIIDANRLAQEAENIIVIQERLYNINEFEKFKVNTNQFENTLFYDLLSFGRPTEFKTQVIESFVLQLFYSNEKLKTEDVKTACEEKFDVKENDIFYERLINRFLSDKQISKNKEDNTYSLTSKERRLLKQKNDQFDLDKQLFLKNILNILIPYNQESYLDDYITELKQLYIDNFNTDLKDILSNDTEFHISSIFKPFIKFIENKIRDKSSANNLAIELLKYCLTNKFIQKLAATKVYSSRIDNNRLQNYINKRKKMFVDTSVGLFSLCYFYKPNTHFDNYFFKATKALLEYVKKENLKLYISERYIWEIQNHLRDAFRLIPFSQIDNFGVLGSSRNVFYNFYNYLTGHDEIDHEKSFTEFLKDFNFTEGSGSDSFNSILEYSLENVNILKQPISKEYKIEEANRLFEEAALKFLKTKSNFARNCDSIMLAFLADKDIDIHPVEPLFLTWDKTFFETHSTYIKKFPNAQNWLTLTPNKIVDVHALLKFSINSETVTENLLALISDDIIINTHSLVDTLAFILNPNDAVGLEYTSRLAKIRENEIQKINTSEVTPPENFEGQAVIDDIMYNLTNHFKENLNMLNDFKTIFTKKEFIEDVINLLVKAIDDFYNRKTFNNSLYSGFEELILKSKKTPSE